MNTTLASLPWYDLPEAAPATDALWALVAEHLERLGLPDVPRSLERRRPYDAQWSDPGLLLSQACGFDAVLGGRGRLRVVATPRYAAPGCRGPLYSSSILVRADSRIRSIAGLRGARAVVNNPTSHSGMNALRGMVLPCARSGRFFASVEVSGDHVGSLELLARGAADVASIDNVVLALLRRHRPSALEGLRVLAVTPAVAAPPYVTSAATPGEVVELLQDALAAAFADPRIAGPAAELLLDGVDFLPLSAYEPIADLHRRARAAGYDELPDGLAA